MNFLDLYAKPLLIAAALLVDRLVGDPPSWPHPVQLFGWLITQLERRWNKGAGWSRRLKGICLVLFMVMLTGGLTWTLTHWLNQVAYGLPLLIWLMSTTLAVHSLRRHALQVHAPLCAGDLRQARRFTAQIVGRDTVNLGERELVRAVVETVAENTVDGITAPLFYLLLFGLPGGMVYKVINTMDSMLGHKNERLLHFGWAAARLDDLANYLPARLSAILLLPVAKLLGYDAALAWSSLRRDAHKHESPNSGWLEASFAGALGVQLGGLNYYQGEAEWRAQLGEPRNELSPGHILQSLQLMQWLCYLFALAGLVCWVVIT